MKPVTTLAIAALLSTTAPALAQAPTGAPARGEDRKLSLNLKDTPFRTAIDLIFAGSGLQYAFEPDLEGAPLTLKVQDITISQALRLVTRMEGTNGSPIVMRKEGDVYVFHRERAAPQQDAATRVFPLHFADAERLFLQLERQAPEGIVSLTPFVRTNSLVARGSSRGLTALAELIEALDVPVPSETRPVTLYVTVEGHGTPVPVRLRSAIVTLSGQDAEMETSATGPRPEHLKVSLRPTTQPDGSMTVASTWDLSLPIPGGKKGPIRLVKRLKTVTPAQPGRTVVLSQLDLASWGGSGTVTLTLRTVPGEPSVEQPAKKY